MTWQGTTRLQPIAALDQSGSTDNFRNFWANTKLEPGAMATATVAALWAYDGWCVAEK
jgi:hypothetical protein